MIAKVFIVGFQATGWFEQFIWWKMFILSFSFMWMSVITRYVNNTISRFFYKLAAVWMGIFVYLFIVSALYGLILAFFCGYMSSNASIIITSIVFIIPILFSIYGLLNARNAIFTRYSLTLPNLPQTWKDKKIVFISDTHFGQVRGEGTAGKWAQLISTEKPDIILHSGDFYDGVKINVVQVATKLAKASSVFGMFAVTGNHESFGDDNYFVDSMEKGGVKVLNDEVINVHGLLIAGARYGTNENKEKFEKNTKVLLEKINALKIKDGLDPDAPVILLKHVPDNIEVTGILGNVLQLSGHTHRGQLWPFRFITHKIFKGFDYGYKEQGNEQIDKGGNNKTTRVITTSGLGTWGPPLRTFTNSEIVVISLQ